MTALLVFTIETHFDLNDSKIDSEISWGRQIGVARWYVLSKASAREGAPGGRALHVGCCCRWGVGGMWGAAATAHAFIGVGTGGAGIYGVLSGVPSRGSYRGRACVATHYACA